MREHQKYRRCLSSSWLRLWMCHSCHWSLGFHNPHSFTPVAWSLTAWMVVLCSEWVSEPRWLCAVGEQLEQTSLENSAWWLQRSEQHAKTLLAVLKLLLCSIQVSGHCSIFSSFLFSVFLFVPQLDVVMMVVEKSLQRLPKSECYSEEEKK